MSTPYVGELRMVGFSFAPVGWAICQGQTIPISENDVLFNLIGTTYGGDGQETFLLPNLAGRVPVHQGTGFVIGQTGGTETVTLTTQQIPQHNHILMANAAAGASSNVQNNILAAAPSGQVYAQNPSADTPMNANSLSLVGGNQPHENLQPFLVINWIISLFGVFPTQS